MKNDNHACFSGYRPGKFGFELHDGCPEYREMLRRIDEAILQSVGEGYGVFYCGMADGFDLICAERVFRVREGSGCGSPRLVAVLPFAGHTVPEAWRESHGKVLRDADESLCLPGTAGREAFLNRNRYMVDNSTRLICWHDGRKGGTAYTVNYAMERGLDIMNLAL